MIKCNDLTGSLGQQMRINEHNTVEKPLLDQLETLGWEVIRLEMQQEPSQSFRSSFDEVILYPKLKEALRRINPFLTPDQIGEVCRTIDSFEGDKLIVNNEQVTELLLNGTTVARNEQTGEQNPLVNYIDFDDISNNSFVAVEQFKLHISGTDHHIIPDIVLFVNGLPLVVIECKSPKIQSPMAEAIDQMNRYSQQRDTSEAEGNARLFYYNLFLIATSRSQAKFGTLTSRIEKFFFRWTDPYPMSIDEVEHGKSSPNDQQRLVAGMLARKNLLDILRVFTHFMTNEKGKRIKIVGRYQQFRAVKLAVHRMLEGQNPLQRGGIIWHTQGSGKSLTMMFLVREMRLHTKLASWKIVFVTDRTQLQKQLADSIRIGSSVKVAESVEILKTMLSNDNSDIVMAMIQKFQERDELKDLGIFPKLNESPNILIMTDEAHRSQYSLLAANLNQALPNATSIGFTGTPTEKTEKKYKDYIDKYTMREAIDDGVTLRIVYQGFTHNAEVDDKHAADQMFEDVFSDYNISERLKILGFGSAKAYLESEDTIREKSKKMVEHYVTQIFPNKFKAQVVAVSREAAIRYKTKLDNALKDYVTQLKISNPQMINVDLLEKLETAVVISGSHNDKPEVKAFTNASYHNRVIDRFKMDFETVDDEDKTKDGNVGIIIVTDMLLTGFDAPIEQVLYLDKVIKAHNLLQTIARVNRIGGDGKDCGFIVDFVGVGHHLKRAIQSNDDREDAVETGEIDGIIDALSNEHDELENLKKADAAIWDYLKKNGVDECFGDEDAFMDLFYDADLRAEYKDLYKAFLRQFNNLLPNKEALVFYKDFINFTEIYALAKSRDPNGLDMREIPEKLRAIADAHLKSKGIVEKIKPIPIFSDEFDEKIKGHKKAKTRAAETEHAIRHQIDVDMDEDPELYASFADAIEMILQNFAGDWDRIYEELEKLRQKMKQQKNENTYGLHRQKQMPVFRIFKKELFGDRELSEDEISANVSLTQQIMNTVIREIKLTGFWDSIPAQNRLKQELQEILLSEAFAKIPSMIQKYNAMISRILEFAKANHFRLIQG
ncbi:type I restriction endonuclease subunit R [Fibrobacter sp.]|uniref:type I restriction endonuclease subunit R n=1 Tax=Fibrobacter sp. TaxID=35828 RepID=UPI00386A13D2